MNACEKYAGEKRNAVPMLQRLIGTSTNLTSKLDFVEFPQLTANFEM
jgi:hypothetical protein